MSKQTDFLIIGSGIAGLTYALKVAAHGKVFMITKANEDESNTKYAQGGIAAVMPGSNNSNADQTDPYKKHIEDTIDCGDGLCNEEVVNMVIRESTKRVTELAEWGANFDKTPEGDYELAREGGHSEHRILHHKDITGYEIERALLNQIHSHPNIEILDHHFAIEIITQHHLGIDVNSRTPDITCFGAYVMDLRSGKVETVLAKTTLIATGGAGQVFQTTTNPTIATGDGIAMVYRAKGKVENMEFMQFHPTSLYNPGERPSFLITEAMRGHGGILRTRDGKEFMQKYDARKSLAPRDIVARAIDSEMKHTGDDFVYLDCTHLDSEDLKKHFPNIYQKCLTIGIDITKDKIPVVPAAHYLCGGIKVDLKGRSSIVNLYAAGECSCTGLHGANRLASNSLLEAVVYSHEAGEHAIANFTKIEFQKNIPEWNIEGTDAAEEMVLITQSIKEVQSIMSSYVGIVRSNMRLERAHDRLEILWRENEALYKKITLSQQVCELRNIINVAYIIIKQARERKESRGLHYTIDYPPLKK